MRDTRRMCDKSLVTKHESYCSVTKCPRSHDFEHFCWKTANGQQLQVDCYVDADFAGLWKVEDDQDPISVKSQSGHLIMFMGCQNNCKPRYWVPWNLNILHYHEYCIITSNAELIACCHEVLKEINTHVLEDSENSTDPRKLDRGLFP